MTGADCVADCRQPRARRGPGACPRAGRRGAARAGTALLAAVLFAAACGRREDVPRVVLSETEPRAESASPEPAALRMAISAIGSPRKNLSDYEAILWHVGRRVGRTVEIVQRETYAESVALVEQRQVDAALMCSGPYVEARERFGAELLAAPRIAGRAEYRSYIIVRAAGPLRSFEDLRGRSFAFTDPMSTTGMLYPAYLLAGRGLAPEDFFLKTVFTRGHDNSVRAVADGLVDGAAVDSIIWEDLVRTQPAVAGRTRVILRSPWFGIPAVIVHPAMGQGLKERLRRAFLSMHEEDEGRALLAKVGIDRFIRPADEAYDGVRRMRAAVRGFSARRR